MSTGDGVGETGAILLTTGDSAKGAAGSFSVKLGESDSLSGSGSIMLTAGANAEHTGGAVAIASGSSTLASSGKVSLESATSYGSGEVALKSGGRQWCIVWQPSTCDG